MPGYVVGGRVDEIADIPVFDARLTSDVSCFVNCLPPVGHKERALDVFTYGMGGQWSRTTCAIGDWIPRPQTVAFNEDNTYGFLYSFQRNKVKNKDVEYPILYRQ
jgi:hypothetical protein